MLNLDRGIEREREKGVKSNGEGVELSFAFFFCVVVVLVLAMKPIEGFKQKLTETQHRKKKEGEDR